MIILHRLVEVIRPLVFQRKNVEEHRVIAVDDPLRGKSLFRFFAIENKGSVPDLNSGGFRHGGRQTYAVSVFILVFLSISAA